MNNFLYPLTKGIANVNYTNEFLLTSTDPTFEVHVNFTFNNQKKSVGYIHIDLKNWHPQTSYE
jgi:hypothetical protein